MDDANCQDAGGGQVKCYRRIIREVAEGRFARIQAIQDLAGATH